jgi:hypothetical protein
VTRFRAMIIQADFKVFHTLPMSHRGAGCNTGSEPRR